MRSIYLIFLMQYADNAVMKINDAMKILKLLQKLSQSPWYWLGYTLGGIALLCDALVYQYVFEELPCVMCIQVRLWISLLVIVSLLGFFLRKNLWANRAMQLVIVLISMGLIERSYLLLGTEKGFVFADCGFNTGLPSWFAIEQWLPWLYEVQASCGYTPELLFGITMAEMLMVLSVGLAVLSVGVLGASFKK